MLIVIVLRSPSTSQPNCGHQFISITPEYIYVAFVLIRDVNQFILFPFFLWTRAADSQKHSHTHPGLLKQTPIDLHDPALTRIVASNYKNNNNTGHYYNHPGCPVMDTHRCQHHCPPTRRMVAWIAVNVFDGVGTNILAGGAPTELTGSRNLSNLNEMIMR